MKASCRIMLDADLGFMIERFLEKHEDWPVRPDFVMPYVPGQTAKIDTKRDPRDSLSDLEKMFEMTGNHAVVARYFLRELRKTGARDAGTLELRERLCVKVLVPWQTAADRMRDGRARGYENFLAACPDAQADLIEYVWRGCVLGGLLTRVFLDGREPAGYPGLDFAAAVFANSSMRLVHAFLECADAGFFGFSDERAEDGRRLAVFISGRPVFGDFGMGFFDVPGVSIRDRPVPFGHADYFDLTAYSGDEFIR